MDAHCMARYPLDLDGRPVTCDLEPGHEGQHRDPDHSAPAVLYWDDWAERESGYRNAADEDAVNSYGPVERGA